jgi:hypothetical protein
MWQTLAIYGSALVGFVAIVYIAFRMIRREARSVGADKHAKEDLEAIVEADRIYHEMAGEPIPMSRSEQLRRLERLRNKVRHRQR